MGVRHGLEVDAADQAHLMAPALQFQQDRQVGLQVSHGPHGDQPDPGHARSHSCSVMLNDSVGS
jgi:hypothetical protein